MPSKSYLPFPIQSHESLVTASPLSRSEQVGVANSCFDPPGSPDSPGSPNIATIRARRYTAPSQFEDSTVKPSKFVQNAIPSSKPSPYSRPRSDSLFADMQQYSGLSHTADYMLGAMRYSAQEYAREAAWLVSEGDRRRSAEGERLANLNSAYFDEETVRHSRIQEKRKMAQARNIYTAEQEGHKSWSTSELPYESATPPTPLREFSPFPTIDPINQKENVSRFYHYLQPQWWKSHSHRKSRDEEVKMEAEARRRFDDALALYESRWNLLDMAVRSSTPYGGYNPSLGAYLISYNDIPWPVLHSIRTPGDITRSSLREFWLSKYLPSGKRAKDRLREGLLRWHPDRFEGRYLEKVRPEDRDKVMDTVGIIVRYLNDEFMTYEKQWI